jgi:hypothetical protein
VHVAHAPEPARPFRHRLESDDFLVLPNKFEIHEWAIMERFSNGQARAAKAGRVTRRDSRSRRVPKFSKRYPTARHRNDWFRFRQTAFEDIAKDWLEAHDIVFR